MWYSRLGEMLSLSKCDIEQSGRFSTPSFRTMYWHTSYPSSEMALSIDNGVEDFSLQNLAIEPIWINSLHEKAGIQASYSSY
jgi:hypothetical protein